MTKKTILSFTILLLLLLGIGGFWYFNTHPETQIPEVEEKKEQATSTEESEDQPVKISTEDWKTCRNEKVGYELKYPSNWHTYGEGSRGDGDSADSVGYTKTTPCSGFYVQFSPVNADEHPPYIDDSHMVIYFTAITQVNLDSQNKNIQSIQDYVSHMPASDRGIAKIKKDYIDGEDAAIFSRRSSGGTTYTTIYSVYVHHNHAIYEFYFSEGVGISASTISAILKSIHFLN